MMGKARHPGGRRITVAAVVVSVIITFTAAVGCATASGGGGESSESGNNGESVEKEQDPDFCYDCFPYPVKKPDTSGEAEG